MCIIIIIATKTFRVFIYLKYTHVNTFLVLKSILLAQNTRPILADHKSMCTQIEKYVTLVPQCNIHASLAL